MNKRNIRKEIQFSEEEFSLIEQKSTMAGISTAMFIRNSALKQEIKAALCQDELNMIRRCQQVNVGLSNNLNQIAKLCNTHGFLPIYDSIIKLIKNIDTYFQTGHWNNVELPDNIKQLEDILKEVDAKYQDLRNKGLYLYYFTYEGEKYFKEKFKCSIYPNADKTKYYFRVKDSNRLAIEIPQQIFNQYKNRVICIKDIYDYFNKH